MIKKLFIIILLILFTTNSFAAGSKPTDPKPDKRSNYTKAVDSIKYAKKYEKKR